ncbi:MAG: acyl-ACP--UDP-N-acetylglucosamine O-acyltransferase [Candidatus Marinimicrobia bacterium]|nr:acyl-ACP--UDP-N-acetylglucosamine O-acyltransferase [Candidatus Neomarinimicrobiota bacterium]
MSIDVHPTAIVDKNAVLNDGVKVGPYTVIESDTLIGENTNIGSHVLIAEGTRIGGKCQIFKGAALGLIPQDLKFHGEKTTLEIGNDTIIREFATLNRGTEASGVTLIGNDSLIMAYVHVAHDCVIGNKVILANGINMGGHVIIEDHVTVGGMTPIHQFVRIGRYSFIGGGYRALKSIPPYVIATGEPMVYRTLNLIGLKRNGFSRETIKALSGAYKQIYGKNSKLQEGLAALKSNDNLIPEVKNIIEFFEASTRGVIGSE